MTTNKLHREMVRIALRATLKNEVCSAQSLDESQDRARVLQEVMNTLDAFGIFEN